MQGFPPHAQLCYTASFRERPGKVLHLHRAQADPQQRAWIFKVEIDVFSSLCVRYFNAGLSVLEADFIAVWQQSAYHLHAFKMLVISSTCWDVALLTPPCTQPPHANHAKMFCVSNFTQLTFFFFSFIVASEVYSWEVSHNPSYLFYWLCCWESETQLGLVCIHKCNTLKTIAAGSDPNSEWI